MAMNTSEKNYVLARELNRTVSEAMLAIESGVAENKEFLMLNVLADAKKLGRLVERIDITELESIYCASDVEKFRNGVAIFKETAYFVNKSVNAMLAFDRLRPALNKYIKEVDWYAVGKTEKDVNDKFARVLTDEDHIGLYKTEINAIVKGTMKAKAFRNLFDRLVLSKKTLTKV